MGGQNSLLAFLFLFLLTLLPCKGWADETWTDPNGSGLELNYTVVDGGVSISKIKTLPSDGKVVIPSEIDEKAVVEIYGGIQFSEDDFKALVVPASVKTIGKSAFTQSSSLTSLTFAEGSQLETIGEYAFYGTGITSVTIPASVTKIESSAFSRTKLTEVIFGNGESLEIGDAAFGYTLIREISIPKSVQSIGNTAFANCSNLASVIVESKTPCALGNYAFFNAYDDGPKFTTDFRITVPSGCETTYKENWSAYEQYIQEVVTPITDATGTLLFEKNTDGDGLILKGFVDGKSATSITIPATVGVDGTAMPVKEIGENALQFKTSLTSVTIEGENLEKIGNNAFLGAGLTSIVIPASVKTLGGHMFDNCSSLESVEFKSETPTYAGAMKIFGESGAPENLKIYVPAKAYDTYCTQLSDYKDYIVSPYIVDGDYTYELNGDGENTVTLVKFTATDSYSENVNVPATFEKDGKTYTVTQIGNGEKINVTVYYRSAMVNAIPNTVTKIGAHAFDHIQFANGVIIPASVKSIGDAAFATSSDDNSTTTSVYSVTLKASEAFTVGEKIFGETSNLLKEHFSILTSSEEVANEFKKTTGWDTYKDYFITEIVKNGLRYRKNGDGTALTLMGFDGDAQSSLTVPAEVDGIPVTAISDRAFMGKSNLKSLDLSQAINLIQIGEVAFEETGLTEVVIPAQVKTLGYSAFGYISSLTKVTFERESDFGESVKYSSAFGGSNNLAEIYVPKDTKSIYASIFEYSIENAEEKIKEIVKPISDGIYKYQLDDDGQTVTVVGIADGVTLKNEVWLRGSVESYEVTGIAANVFSNMPEITQLHIPSCVSTIAANAFADMKSGLKVYFDRTDDISGYSKDMFGTTEVSSINVPTEAYAAYYEQLANDKNIEEKIEKPVYTLDITDDSENGVTTEMEGKTYEAGKITYKRTFSQAGQYGTIALPFNVASSEWNEYFDAVYTVSGAESMGDGLSKLKFQEVEQNATLNAKDAYFVKLKDNVKDILLTNAGEAQIVVDPMVNCHSVSYDGNDGTVTITPHASWQKVEGNGTQYYTFNADGTFGKSDYVVPFRMCLTIETSGGGNFIGAPAFFSIELPGGSTTGINGVSAEKASKNAAIYSIDGKLVRANGDTKGLAKGVYIIGGKKIVVK